METASLVVPTTEILPITCHRQEIQNRTDSSVTFGPATEDEHGASNTTVTIEGSTRSIQNAYVQLVDVLSQSDQLFKYECSPYSSELLADWGTRELFLFQKKFAVFIVCDDSGGYALKAWNESNISDARAELREMFSDSNTSVSDVSSSDSEGSDDLSTSSDDSDNCAMSHMMKIKVSGSPSLSRNKIERIQKKTGATIDIMEKTEAAVEKLSVLLNLKTPDFDGDTRKDSSYQKTSDKNNNNYHQTNIKLPPVMNILVLGETGVGKSTFINGLVNYLKCGSIEEALQRGVEILIPSSFTLTDDNYETREIVNRATIDDGEELQNEHLGRGQSATQDPKSYVFSWNDEEGEKKIRIIDTPGIGDTRGLDQDKLNFDKILSFIAGYSELHAVCILIKPNTARLTLAFRFCIDELLVHLHKSASENILFCFTNTRGTLYKPGDTLPTLREHLSKLKTHRNIDIPTNKDTLFSFDNESFRFLCACKENFQFSDTDRRNFDLSWNKSVEETLRLFARISELPVHPVHDTLSLNNTRTIILALSRPLAEIAKNQLINLKLIEDKVKEVEEHKNAGKQLKGRLTVKQVMIRPEEIEYPRTVCTAAKCVEHRRFNADTNSVMQTIYKTVCHSRCYLEGVQSENCPNTKLQHCSAMGSGVDGLDCHVCGCKWSTHMHIRYVLHETMEEIEDPTVRASIANKDGMVKTIEVFLSAERKKMDELRGESEKITKYCAEFASFLAKNSILPYNDSYGAYIEHLIKEERGKVTIGGSDGLLERLEQYRNEYEQQVRVLDTCMKSQSASTRSVDSVNEMVKELKQLKHCGSVLAEIEKLELLQVRETQCDSGKVVALNNTNSWFAGARRAVRRGARFFKRW